jgi:hypothetical protein
MFWQNFQIEYELKLVEVRVLCWHIDILELCKSPSSPLHNPLRGRVEISVKVSISYWHSLSSSYDHSSMLMLSFLHQEIMHAPGPNTQCVYTPHSTVQECRKPWRWRPLCIGTVSSCSNTCRTGFPVINTMSTLTSLTQCRRWHHQRHVNIDITDAMSILTTRNWQYVDKAFSHFQARNNIQKLCTSLLRFSIFFSWI